MFCQITLAKDTPSYVAKLTPIGILRPRCMPQGLKTALYHQLWSPLIELGDGCDPYINDIIFGTQKKDGTSDQDLVIVGV